MSLGAALTLMLKQLDLTYVVQYEALHITTPEEAENELTTVAYPVTDLIRYRDSDGKPWSDFDTLIETITSTISPDAWEEVGGAGAIEAIPIQDTDVLVISQTQQIPAGNRIDSPATSHHRTQGPTGRRGACEGAAGVPAR